MNPQIKRKREKHERITPRYITKYEKTRLVGARANELSLGLGEPITINLSKGDEILTDPLQIAEEEFNQKTIPLQIRRFLPDNTYEDWNVAELKWVFGFPENPEDKGAVK